MWMSTSGTLGTPKLKRWALLIFSGSLFWVPLPGRVSATSHGANNATNYDWRE